MIQEEAIKILIQVALVAQSKGLLSLEDAVVVKQAIDLLKPASTPVTNEIPVEDAEEVI